MQLAFPGMEEKPGRQQQQGPLSRQESRRIGELYVEHRKLVHHFTRKMRSRFPMMAPEDVASCVDVAFIKAARRWDAARGRLSTIFGVFALGECRHYVRDHNWQVKAPPPVRELGMKVRRLMDQGMSADRAAAELGIDREELRLALLATAGVAHDLLDFELHVSGRQTPMEWLEALEGQAMAELQD